MLITTTGRKSGQPRTNPLLYAPDGDGYAVVGSNWGKNEQPAWALNLVAEPAAVVTVGGTETRCARYWPTGSSGIGCWRLLTEMWPAYDTYVERARNREIKVFRLAPEPERGVS